jgi:ABC-2 type transport system permease protein
MKPVLMSWLLLLRRSRTGLVALLAGIAAFEFIQPVAIDSFGDLDRLISIMDLVPKPFLSLLNVTPEVLEAIGLPGFLALGFTHPVYHLLSAATVIWLAGRGLAGEMERGTIQLALARPVSRGQIYLSRVLAVLSASLLVAVASSIGMIVGLEVAKPDGTMNYWHFFAQAAASVLLVVCIGGFTLAISASSERMGQAVGIAIGLLVVSYVIDYFATLWGVLEPLQPYSIFDYYNPPAALASGTVPTQNILVLGAIAVAGTIAGLIVFQRRDLPT